MQVTNVNQNIVINNKKKIFMTNDMRKSRHFTSTG